MLGQQFYHETIRNVVVGFGTIFNNIQLVRKDNSGVIQQTMKVPLAYGPKLQQSLYRVLVLRLQVLLMILAEN
jgi:hypothetical protein